MAWSNWSVISDCIRDSPDGEIARGMVSNSKYIHAPTNKEMLNEQGERKVGLIHIFPFFFFKTKLEHIF